MKTAFLAISITSVFTLGAAFAADTSAPSARKPSKQERIMQRTGGWIVDRSYGKGKIVFVNAQKIVPLKDVKANAAKMEDYCRCVFDVQTKDKIGMSDIALVKSEFSANALIALVESDDLPGVLVAPEENWGIVNVSKLNSDRPADEVLGKRLKKEMWRAFGFIGGSSDSTMACVMSAVTDLSSLDALRAGNISPETMMRIEDHLAAIGVTQFRRGTYKDACRAGWAPEPTNEYQKAIWEQVHAIPQKPLKIEFDPKTDTK